MARHHYGSVMQTLINTGLSELSATTASAAAANVRSGNAAMAATHLSVDTARESTDGERSTTPIVTPTGSTGSSGSEISININRDATDHSNAFVNAFYQYTASADASVGGVGSGGGDAQGRAVTTTITAHAHAHAHAEREQRFLHILRDLATAPLAPLNHGLVVPGAAVAAGNAMAPTMRRSDSLIRFPKWSR